MYLTREFSVCGEKNLWRGGRSIFLLLRVLSWDQCHERHVNKNSVWMCVCAACLEAGSDSRQPYEWITSRVLSSALLSSYRLTPVAPFMESIHLTIGLLVPFSLLFLPHYCLFKTNKQTTTKNFCLLRSLAQMRTVSVLSFSPSLMFQA